MAFHFCKVYMRTTAAGERCVQTMMISGLDCVQLVVRCSRRSCGPSTAKRTCCSGWLAKNSSTSPFQTSSKRKPDPFTTTTSRSYRPKRFADGVKLSLKSQGKECDAP